MKRPREEDHDDSSSDSSLDDAPTPLKVHVQSGYTFEFVNDVEINGEIFMPVPEWYITDNSTSVSNQGRVKSYSGVITTPTPKKDGYSSVEVKGKGFPITHLILHAFNVEPNSLEHKQVNHKDRDPTNNRLDNLEWCTPAENLQHSHATNPNRKSTAPKQAKPVECFIDGKWQAYASVMEAARQLGLNHGNIAKACHKGYLVNEYRFRFGTPNEPETLENEEWRNIAGSKGQVSSLGRYKDVRGIIKTPTPNPTGYVSVRVDGKSHLIHRLIAKCFLPPPLSGQTQVNHKDRNPLNNHHSNLEWVTPSENIRHSFANNKDRKSNAPQRSKKVRTTKDGQIQIFASTKEAERQLRIPQCTISRHCCQNAKIAAVNAKGQR